MRMYLSYRFFRNYFEHLIIWFKHSDNHRRVQGSNYYYFDGIFNGTWVEMLEKSESKGEETLQSQPNFKEEVDSVKADAKQVKSKS